MFSVCNDIEVAKRIARWLEEHYVQNEDGFVHVCRLDEQGSKVTGSEL
jgi:homoserine kinase